MTAQTALHLLCDKYQNRIFASDAVKWAIQELIEGRDADALRRLAAVVAPADWWEVEPLLRQSFDELGYEWPDEEKCYWKCATDTARDILSGDTSTDEGCAWIWQMCVALDYPEKLLPWDHLCADLDPDSLRELSPHDFSTAVVKQAKRLLGEPD